MTPVVPVFNEDGVQDRLVSTVEVKLTEVVTPEANTADPESTTVIVETPRGFS